MKTTDFLLKSPEMQAAYTIAGLAALVKIARDPEAQKRFESFIERFTPHSKKIAEALTYAGVAVLGYDTFGDWRGAVYGMISLKLATTEGGTPPVAQVSGLAGLAALGIAEFVGLPNLVEMVEETVKPIMPGGYTPSKIYDWKAEAEKCSQQLYPETEWGKIRGYLYGYRGRSLDQIADMMIKNGYSDVVECTNAVTGLDVGLSWTVCQCDENGDGIVDILDINQMFSEGKDTKAKYCSQHCFNKICSEHTGVAPEYPVGEAPTTGDPAYDDFLRRKAEGQLSPCEQTYEFNVWLKRFMREGYSFSQAYSLASRAVC